MNAPLVPEPLSLEMTVMSFDESKSEPDASDAPVEAAGVDEHPASIARAMKLPNIDFLLNIPISFLLRYVNRIVLKC